MSTEFYISNRIKKREVTSLNSFWEKQLIPELKKHITDYCNELNGQYINNDVANRIIDSKISPISSVMDDSFNYETLIGTWERDTFSMGRRVCRWTCDMR